MAEFFKRVEKKYMVTNEQYTQILNLIKDKMEEDEHGVSTICNIYFDSPDFNLIRHSIEKPAYKDKIRVRSYNVPNKESDVFLEIKRKVDGVVTKRRIKSSLEEVERCVENGNIEHQDRQVSSEIDYYFKFYHLEPKTYIAYDRRAYYAKDDREFRLTFDTNIISRTEDLKLENGIYGEKILKEEKYIMEVKTLGAVPIWFVKVLSDLEIKPCSYSKYGEVYKKILKSS